MDNRQGSPHPLARILIVEDSPTQAQQLVHILKRKGYQVESAGNGRLALEKLTSFRPELIISDIVMPEMDGYDLCRAVKASGMGRGIPVILVTTLAESQDVVRGLECGADHFIRKPYEEGHLLARVDYLLKNTELRKNQKFQMAVEIELNGTKHLITSERLQILDMLISTYEQAIGLNAKLSQREQELANTNRKLLALNRISEGLNRSNSVQEVAEVAVELMMDFPGVQAGWIFLRDGVTAFRLVAARNLPPALVASGALEGPCDCCRRLLAGQLGNAVGIRKCERLNKAGEDNRGICHHAAVPLQLADGRIMGVMNLGGPAASAFEDEEIKVLFGIGNQVAVALERAQLLEDLELTVQERTAKLEREVAQRQKAEMELRKLNEDLEDRVEQARYEADQANHAKSAFLATMSHEIRTPMNGVIGMIDVLHQTSLKGYQVEMVELIRESAYSLLSIIEDILDFSKIEAGKLEIEQVPMGLAGWWSIPAP